MEVRSFKQERKSGVLGYIVIILTLLSIGVFFSWKLYFIAGSYSFVSLIPVITVSLVIFFLGFTCQKLGFLCPKCKSRLNPHYARMENDTEIWEQIQFSCEKCGIIWDTGVKTNLRKYGKWQPDESR
jgi:hypothetical protein